jgi:NO-binding membrane sensor protein with MHYT domain
MTAGSHPWRLVIAGGVVMGLSLGARHVQGLFLLPLTTAHDWPRDTYSTALALQNLLWGLSPNDVAVRSGQLRLMHHLP